MHLPGSGERAAVAYWTADRDDSLFDYLEAGPAHTGSPCCKPDMDGGISGFVF